MNNIPVLSFIRSCFLYIYYWMSIKESELKKRRVSRVSAFSFISLLFLLGLVVLFIIASEYFPEQMGSFYNNLESKYGKAHTHKGTINVGFSLLVTSLAITCCYLVCCYRVEFNDIPNRLQYHASLSKFSWWKLGIPFYLPIIVWLLYLFLS